MFKIQACSKLSERSMEDARQSHRKLGPIDEEWTQVFLSYREAVGIDDREAFDIDEEWTQVLLSYREVLLSYREAVGIDDR